MIMITMDSGRDRVAHGRSVRRSSVFPVGALAVSLAAWLSAVGVAAQAAARTPTAPASPVRPSEAARPASSGSPGRRPPPATAEVKLGADQDPDKTRFVAVCEECHGTLMVTYSGRRSAVEWAGVVDEMIARGAPGTDADAQVVTAYLFRHYGRVNVNKASQEDLVVVLDISPAQAKALGDYRAANGEFKSVLDLERAGVVDAATLQDRKDRIAFSGN